LAALLLKWYVHDNDATEQMCEWGFMWARAFGQVSRSDKVGVVPPQLVANHNNINALNVHGLLLLFAEEATRAVVVEDNGVIPVAAWPLFIIFESGHEPT
jgi:hypothetical protein